MLIRMGKEEKIKEDIKKYDNTLNKRKLQLFISEIIVDEKEIEKNKKIKDDRDSN